MGPGPADTAGSARYTGRGELTELAPMFAARMSRRALTAPFALGVALGVALGACAPARPDLVDPREILAGAVAQIEDASTVRLQLDVSGAVAIDLLGSGTARPMLLEGTNLTADVDIAEGRLKATFASPALLGLTGEFLAPGGRAYLRTSLTGPKYLPLDPAGLAPGASPVSSSGPALAGLTSLLDDPSVTATKLDDVDCADTRCYRVRLDVDPSKIDLGLPDLGALEGLGGLFGLPGLPGGTEVPGSSPAVGAPLDPIVVIVSIAKDTLRPVTLASDIVMGETATLELVLTFSAWGESVSVVAPSNEQVGDVVPPGGLPFPFPGT